MSEKKMKRPSGAFFRNRKKERDIKKKQLQSAMFKYLKLDENQPST